MLRLRMRLWRRMRLVVRLSLWSRVVRVLRRRVIVALIRRMRLRSERVSAAMVCCRRRVVVVERRRWVTPACHRSGDCDVLRMAAVELGIRIVIVHRGIHVLGLE